MLVGAGPLGKIYCALAKESGAVAIDVGSVLDGWMSIASREDIGGPIKDLFKIEHLLDEPNSPEEARERLVAIVSNTRFSDGFY